MIEDLLDELEFKGHEYKIENGWFQMTLGKSFIWFRITDEYEIGELLHAIWMFYVEHKESRSSERLFLFVDNFFPRINFKIVIDKLVQKFNDFVIQTIDVQFD